jgi:hypothetical protein
VAAIIEEDQGQTVGRRGSGDAPPSVPLVNGYSAGSCRCGGEAARQNAFERTILWISDIGIETGVPILRPPNAFMLVTGMVL